MAENDAARTELQSLGIVERDHASWSQLNTYNDCGQKYYLSYIVKAPREPQGALIGGILVHSVIEVSEREGWWTDAANFARPAAPNAPEAPAIALYHERLDEEIAKAGGLDAIRWAGRGGGEDYRWWWTQGEFMLRRYQQTREQMHGLGWGLAEDRTEYRVEVMIEGTRKPIVAYLDKYLMHETGEPLIVDWKTGKIGNAAPLQFATYAKVVQATRGVLVSRGVAAFLRAPDAERRVQPVNFLPLLDRLAELYNGLEDGIDAGLFPPHPSWMCKGCSVRSACWYWNATEGDVEP